MALMYRADLLERTLAGLCNWLEGVRAAVIVSGEGPVVASHLPGHESFLEDGSAHSSQMAAMASTLVGLGERSLSRLGLGCHGAPMPIGGSDGALFCASPPRHSAM